MSWFKEMTLACRECGATQPFIAWESVNATLEPERKKKLLAGELTRFLCKACGWDGSVSHSLIYHDPEKHLMFWLWPGPGSPNEVMPVEPFASKYHYRHVPTNIALIEKILLFDAHLDDRVIECLKLKLYAHVGNNKPNAQLEFLFASIEKPADRPEEIRFDFTQAGENLQVCVPMDIYLELETLLAPKFRTAMSGTWEQVDHFFAHKLLV